MSRRYVAIYEADVYRYAQGIKFIAVAPSSPNEHFELEPAFKAAIQEYKSILGSNLYLAANRSYEANDNKKLFRL